MCITFYSLQIISTSLALRKFWLAGVDHCVLCLGVRWLQRHLGGFFIKRKLDTATRKDVLYRKVLHEVNKSLYLTMYSIYNGILCCSILSSC